VSGTSLCVFPLQSGPRDGCQNEAALSLPIPRYPSLSPRQLLFPHLFCPPTRVQNGYPPEVFERILQRLVWCPPLPFWSPFQGRPICTVGGVFLRPHSQVNQEDCRSVALDDSLLPCSPLRSFSLPSAHRAVDSLSVLVALMVFSEDCCAGIPTPSHLRLCDYGQVKFVRLFFSSGPKRPLATAPPNAPALPPPFRFRVRHHRRSACFLFFFFFLEATSHERRVCKALLGSPFLQPFPFSGVGLSATRVCRVLK